MKIIEASDQSSLLALKRRRVDFDGIVEKMRPIVLEVKKNGDTALKRFAREFDGVELGNIVVSAERRREANRQISEALRQALLAAKENIIKFHRMQMPQEWIAEVMPGVEAGQLIRPIERVGCYVPGGKYPLVSTVLMTVLPAKVAKVKEVIVCTPKASSEILAACEIAGVDQVFEVGGAAAIAAMAYGTESIPKVDKIVGPGSLYVTAAKKIVYGDVGIDFIAGPSEVVIVAEAGANPLYIAADLIAQAEHDEASMSLLITPSRELAEQVKNVLEEKLKNLLTAKVARKALEQNGAIILVDSLQEALEISNFFAPEHLEIFSDDPSLLEQVQNAGSIFLGENSPEAAGDYASGPNHVLPTGGFARSQSGLSVRDFLKTPTVQRLSKKGLTQIADTVMTIAEAEGLQGHAQSIQVRLSMFPSEYVQEMKIIQCENQMKELQPKQSVLQIKPYSHPEEGRMDYLRLDFNENTQGASPKAIEALKKITQEECACYPEYEKFTEALSKFLGVDKQKVLPTNGSDEAIRVLFNTYVDRDEEVVLLTPSYALYELFAQIEGAKIVWVPYRADFSFPIEEVLQAIRPSTRLIAIANPNNPTGTLIGREDLRKIIEANPQMVVLLDEAYSQFAKVTNWDFIDTYSNVFVTQTFSKAYGLAGLRIGYLISSPENIEVISKVLSPTYSVDRAAMAAAIATMEDAAYFNRYIDEVIAAREEFIREMHSLGFSTLPSQTNFVLVNFGKQARNIRMFLETKEILVRERSEKALQGYLRITIGTREQMQKLIQLLNSFLTKQVLIFDMDGVLIDEKESYRQCIVKTVEVFSGKQIDQSMIAKFKEKGGYNNDYVCTQAILSELGVEVSLEEIIPQFDDYYKIFKTAERWLLDESVLLKLKERFRLGIFTGRPKRDALDALQRFNKESFFEIVVTDDDVGKRKPDPEGLLLALRILGVEKATYLGDTKDDWDAAQGASVPFIGVVSPGGSNEIFKRLGVEVFLENISQIEEILCQKEQ